MLDDEIADDSRQDIALKRVLPYRSSDARPRTPVWVWLMLGFGVGIGFMLLVFNLRWTRSVASVQVAASATVVKSQSFTNSNPLAQGNSLTAEQDAGRIVRDDWAIGVPYGKFVLFGNRNHVVAIRIRCPGGVSRKIVYEWREVGDESQQGVGEAAERDVVDPPVVRAGPITLSWSQGSANGGWLYWSGANGLAVAMTPADSVEEFAAVMKSPEWKNRFGETVDPPGRANPAPATSKSPAAPRMF